MVVLVGLIIPLFNIDRITRRSGNIVTQHAVNTGLKIYQGLSKTTVSYILAGKLVGPRQNLYLELLKIYELSQWALPFYSSRLGLEHHMVISGMTVDATSKDLENVDISIVLERVSNPGKLALITSGLSNIAGYLTTPDPALGMTPIEFVRTIDAIPRPISIQLGVVASIAGTFLEVTS